TLDDALEGRAHLELVHAALRVVERQALARQLAFLGAKLEHDVLALELCGLGGVLAADLRRAQRVLGLNEAVLGNDAGHARLFDALVYALRGNALDLRGVRVALREELLLSRHDLR